MVEVPFFGNSSDGTHCVQAVFRMMLKTFLPERDFSWRELDKLTHKARGKGTWWLPALSEFKAMGLNTKLIEAFDYDKFYKEGEKYAASYFEPEIAKWHLEKSHLMEIRPLIPEFVKNVSKETRPAVLADLNRLIDGGWLVSINVNSRTLGGKPGFSGHVALVYARTGQNYWLHNPGLPPQKARKISQQLLKKSWAYAGVKNMALLAVKPSK